MEMAKRNRLGELYAIERAVLEKIEAIKGELDPDDWDKEMLKKLNSELDSVRRRIQAVKNMPDDG